MSKESISKFMERGSDLNAIEDSTMQLSTIALDFEKRGKELKQKLDRQKLKLYVIIMVFLLFFFVLVYLKSG